MAKLSFVGIDDYISQLKAFDVATEHIIGEAIYEGAELVADEVKSALTSLPVDNRGKVPMRKGIHQVQKYGLIRSFGIAKLEDDNDFRNVKLGFDGYNDFITFKFPFGQPNVMIARTIESGTSFLPKTRAISKAVNRSKKGCEQRMRESIDKNCKKIFK